MPHPLRLVVDGNYEGRLPQQHALWDGHLPYYGKFLVPICVTDLMKLTPLSLSLKL